MTDKIVNIETDKFLVFPTSFTQTKLWFFSQLQPDSSAYNTTVAYCLEGRLNVEALEQSFLELIRRHESLRTTFTAADESPQQLISPDIEFSLSIVDLQDLSETQKEIEAQALAQQQAQQPFNLTNDLLLRVKLLCLAPERHILLITLHHIIFDRWSISVLEKELAALYPAFVSGKPSPLPELPIQYADFTVWQQDWLQGEVLETLMAYWKQQLSGHLPILELPTDYSRPSIQTTHGAAQLQEISPILTVKLKQLSQGYGVTLFMTLLAVFQVLLYRYSAQEDIIIGTPIAGRRRIETEGLIGFFANTLALRTNLSGNPSFPELLERVRKVALGAYAHQDMPFEKLVAELQPQRDMSHSPIFQVMFALHNIPKYTMELPDLTLSSFSMEQTTAQFDLSLGLTETPQGIQAQWIYNTDLFDSGTITRMMGHFLSLLEGVVADPTQAISKLPVLTESEQHQILIEWNDTTADYPKDLCIHQLFEQQVKQKPDAIAVVFEEQELTYQQLNQKANQLAHYLQQLGVKPEVLVGLSIERSLEMIVGILGILKAGGAYVPLDPKYPTERLKYILEDAQVSVLVTQSDWQQTLPNNNIHTVFLDTQAEAIALGNDFNPISKAEPDNLAYVIYTSGSTGQPKGVLVPHRGLCNIAVADQKQYALSKTSRVLQFASLSFDVSIWETIIALCSGARLYLTRRESALPGLDLQALLQQAEITHMIMPPSALAVMSPENLPALEVVITGAEACGADLAQQWSVSGHRFFHGYGPTEATIYCTVTEWTGKVSKPPIGRPIANVTTYILDSNLQPVPISIPGELYIGGIGVARGYLNRPELTTDKFIPNPFGAGRLYKTGDQARYLSDGNIEFLGRIDHQVKIRGFRIELGGIEAILNQYPDIKESVVIVREDQPGEKRLVAYWISQTSSQTTTQLRSFLKSRLPEYMIPAAFVELEAFPLNPNGKIDRRALPIPDASALSSSEAYVAPQTPIQKQLASIWSAVLGIEQVGIDHNFFELGGHSLLATQVISRIHKNFNIELPLRSLFECPTVAELAKTIEQLTAQNTHSSLPEIVAVSRENRRKKRYSIE